MALYEAFLDRAALVQKYVDVSVWKEANRSLRNALASTPGSGCFLRAEEKSSIGGRDCRGTHIQVGVDTVRR